MALLVEDLMLLLTEDRHGHFLCDPAPLADACAASVLADLQLAGRITLTAGDSPRIAVLDPSPTGDALLDGACATLADSALTPAEAISHLAPGLLDDVTARLTAAGRLGIHQGRIDRMLHITHHPTTQEGRMEKAALADEAVGVLNGADDPTPRTSALIALVQVLRSTEQIFPGAEGDECRGRAEHMVEQSWPALAARQALHDLDVLLVSIMASSAGPRW